MFPMTGWRLSHAQSVDLRDAGWKARAVPGGAAGLKCKNALERARFGFYHCELRLRQYELNRGLDREIVAPEHRDCSEGSVLALRAPALLERRLAFSLQRLAAHR